MEKLIRGMSVFDTDSLDTDSLLVPCLWTGGGQGADC